MRQKQAKVFGVGGGGCGRRRRRRSGVPGYDIRYMFCMIVFFLFFIFDFIIVNFLKIEMFDTGIKGFFCDFNSLLT